VELCEGLVPAPASSVSGLSPGGYRMLQAIGELPEDERDVFDLVWIDGMTKAESAQVLGGSIIRVAPKRRAHTRHRGGAASTGARARGRPDVVSP
jgi:hypothetical protein